MTVIILTSGTSWTVPNDWNSSSNIVEAIGGGGGGGLGDDGGAGGGAGSGAGGAGAYAKITNFSSTAGTNISITIGRGGYAGDGGIYAVGDEDGGDTVFDSSSTLLAKGGLGIVGGTAGATGGDAASCVPSTGAHSGGNGGAGVVGSGTTGGGAGGGAGAGGTTADGSDGTDGSGSTGGAGGAGGTVDGGAGGSSNSGAGSAGTTWNGSSGPGGGGGGGAGGTALNPGVAGGASALYGSGGAGGGGGGSLASAGIGTTGRPGLIVISYNPIGPISGTASMDFAPSGELGGTGALNGSSAMLFSLPGVLKGEGSLLGTSVCEFGSLSTISGTGELVGSGNLVFTPSAALTGSGELTGVSALTLDSSALLSALPPGGWSPPLPPQKAPLVIPLCGRAFDESSGCYRIDEFCKPVPCIEAEIGDCPAPDDTVDSTGIVFCTPMRSCYRGLRDYPRPWFGMHRPGFMIGGIVQYFWVPAYHNPILVHSHLAFTFNSEGHFKYVELDNHKIPRHILWDLDKPNPQVSELQASSSCPVTHIVPAIDAESSTGLRNTKGCIVRVMALQGLYDCVQPSGVSSNPHSFPVIDPETWPVKVVFPAETLTCTVEGGSSGLNIINMVDPSMTNIASEMALEIDSVGHLCKVYWGGMNKCDANPLAWDRDNPPPNQPGVTIPLMQSSLRWGLDDSGSFDIWLLHFDSVGHYMFSCLYMRICMCQPSCTRDDCHGTSSIPQPFCVCKDLCLILGYCEGGAASINQLCPDTASIDCDIALHSECPSVQDSGFCIYDKIPGPAGCCDANVTEPPQERLELDQRSDPGDPNKGCFYLGETATRTCTTIAR